MLGFDGFLALMKMVKMGFCGFLGWERGFFVFFVKSADFFCTAGMRRVGLDIKNKVKSAKISGLFEGVMNKLGSYINKKTS